jgi:colicin import membrane protein
LKKGLMVSAGAHVALLIYFLIKNLIFPSTTFESLPAVRVDIVGLPDKVSPDDIPVRTSEPEAKAPPEPEATKPKAEPTPAPKTKPLLPSKTDPEAINLDKAKAKQKEALSKLKSLEALDRIKEDVSQEGKAAEQKRLDALAANARAQAGLAKIKGNILAAGSELAGIDRLQHEEYRSNLDRHIKPFWQLPEWLGRKKLKAQVLIKIDGQGRLISKQLLKPSGNPDFDDSVLQTIDRAIPLPAPPVKFGAKVGLEGILLEFGESE